MQQRKKNYLGHKPLYDRERLLEAQSLASQHSKYDMWVQVRSTNSNHKPDDTMAKFRLITRVANWLEIIQIGVHSRGNLQGRSPNKKCEGHRDHVKLDSDYERTKCSKKFFSSSTTVSSADTVVLIDGRLRQSWYY